MNTLNVIAGMRWEIKEGLEWCGFVAELGEKYSDLKCLRTEGGAKAGQKHL